MLLFRDVKVFDGEEVLPPTHVTVAEGLIAAIGEAEAPGAVVIEGRGATLIPGLIDAHAHAFPGDLEQASIFGVTTVLDMMADPAQAAKLRATAAAAPELADLRTAGTAATIPGGYGWYLVEMGLLPPFPTLTAPEQAEAFVAERLAEGSDYLKILLDDGSTVGMPTPTMPNETLHALVAAAHDRGRITVAHALTAESARLAVAAGVDVLGHLFVDQPAPELAYELAARETVVIPTLAVLGELFGRSQGRQLAADPRVAPYLGEGARRMLTMEPVPLGEGARHDFDVATRTLAELRDAGVTVLAGSDASNMGTAHGATLHHELRQLVAAGLTPREALTAATAAPARCFGLTDRGKIAPGLRADLVLIDGDPTADIDHTLDILGVWRDGQRLTREHQLGDEGPLTS
ncbi:amidohydrolase family protein [Nonomuraea turcica]|uniref:amidohydrolase family protein n=1 Tax=Nonomuraea sp. G32 TaxID=3067274 RepID=UPI00273A895F|nr:amidohydrolase family protein [Nonomuraea sp. G32]MDP4510379.1 amidohydrolase family protein [Nonomuraea sp. G32]